MGLEMFALHQHEFRRYHDDINRNIKHALRRCHGVINRNMKHKIRRCHGDVNRNMKQYNVCNILYPRRTHLRPVKRVCCVFDLSHTTSGRLRRMGCIPQRRKYVQFLYSGVPSSHVNRQWHTIQSSLTITLVVIDTDCIRNCKSNYHTITAMTSPSSKGVTVQFIRNLKAVIVFTTRTMKSDICIVFRVGVFLRVCRFSPPMKLTATM
jgi:hypothetical protein